MSVLLTESVPQLLFGIVVLLKQRKVFVFSDVLLARRSIASPKSDFVPAFRDTFIIHHSELPCVW
jgi:hypothetical protein